MTPRHCRLAALVSTSLFTAASLAAAFAPTSEVMVHVKSYGQDPTTVLNRFTFTGNVLEGLGDPAQNWVVFFTSLSDPEGARLVPSFRVLAGDIATQFNAGRLFSSVAKFAVVDCHVEQELCREQNIDHLPSLVHFRDGVQVAQWRSKSGVGMLPWLRSQLMGGPLPAKMRREDLPTAATGSDEKGSTNKPPASAVDPASEAAAPVPGPSDDGVNSGGNEGGGGGEDACRAADDENDDDVAEDELRLGGRRRSSSGFIQRLRQTSFPPALTVPLVLGIVGASFWIVLQGVLLEP